MSRFAKILFLIVLLDAGSTVAGLNLGHFNEEANPIMAWYLMAGGPLLLVAAKIWITVLGISVLELAGYGKLVSGRMVRSFYLFTIGVYLLLYASSVIVVNHL